MDLRGASAEAVSELRSELDDALRAGQHAGRVADELFSVASLLRSEAALRRVATDVTAPAEAKQALIGRVFGSQVDDSTLGLVTSAVARRWTVSGDLPDALERLSEITLVKSVGKDSDRLADEVFGLSRTLTAHPELRDALSNPARTVEDKAALVDDLLDGKVLPATVTLAKQALAGTYRTVMAALESYRRVVAEVQGEYVATVRVVSPLAEAERDRLTKALSQQYGREIHLNEIVDPDVVGGVRVEIGDDVIDGSVSSRLDDARRQLAG